MTLEVFGAKGSDTTQAINEATVAVEFTLAEMWVLHKSVRHEVVRVKADEWSFPPCSKPLNDKIAEAILFCEEFDQLSAALQLTKHDCYVIDYCVSDAEKDVNGNFVGANINLKQFAARRALDEGECDTRPDSDYTYLQMMQKGNSNAS